MQSSYHVKICARIPHSIYVPFFFLVRIYVRTLYMSVLNQFKSTSSLSELHLSRSTLLLHSILSQLQLFLSLLCSRSFFSVLSLSLFSALFVFRCPLSLSPALLSHLRSCKLQHTKQFGVPDDWCK